MPYTRVRSAVAGWLIALLLLPSLLGMASAATREASALLRDLEWSRCAQEPGQERERKKDCPACVMGCGAYCAGVITDGAAANDYKPLKAKRLQVVWLNAQAVVRAACRSHQPRGPPLFF